MRITGGQARSIPLKVPKGEAVRPATDRMREAVFSRLGEAVDGARVIDLFAGSGSYGLEALSRGASSSTFVERDGRTRALLKENLAAVKKAFAGCGEGTILGGDALTVPLRETGFDLVFVDPPYGLWPEIASQLFARLDRHLAPEGEVIAEAPGGQLSVPPGWTVVRRLGDVGGQGPGIAFVRRGINLRRRRPY